MSTNGVIDDFKHAIAEQIEAHEAGLGRGEAKDWADYKDRVGKIKGLKKAQDLFLGVLGKYIDQEEEAE